MARSSRVDGCLFKLKLVRMHTRALRRQFFGESYCCAQFCAHDPQKLTINRITSEQSTTEQDSLQSRCNPRLQQYAATKKLWEVSARPYLQPSGLIWIGTGFNPEHAEPTRHGIRNEFA
jgi:hypothetical protein